VKFLAKLVFVLVLVAAGVAAWLWFCIERPYQAFPSEGVFVNLPHGASSRAAARSLQQNGVIRNALAFELYARRHPKRRLQAGEYFFSAPISGHDVFWQIADGHIYEQPFTVREGETMFDIARDLEAAKFMTAADFLAAARDPGAVRDFAPRAETLEGFLFPATYSLPRHPAPAEVTAEMVRKFKEEWQAASSADSSAPPDTTISGGKLSIVTLASLVERETPKPEERPIVAGVFENRLRKNMPLQCDPTVIYALEETGSYNGSLTSANLHLDSPYNTYTRPGLPPGPIGNPGEESLHAALRPTQTNFLYFVANTEGGHFFSATLAEHNRNVLRYRRLLAGLPADPPPPLPAKVNARKSPNKRHRGTAR
jgi:UPF0755 protein